MNKELTTETGRELYLKGMIRLMMLLLICLFASCLRNMNLDGQLPVTDTAMVVAFDTSITVTTAWDPLADSIAKLKERDSFFAIPPKMIFVGSPESFCWDQCAAFFLDTSRVVTERIKVKYEFEQVTDWKFDVKANRYWFSWDQYTLGITEPDPYEYAPQQFTMNGWLLKPGVSLDTTVSGSWFLNNIDLDEEEFWRLTAGPRHFIVATGFIRHCNGMGCGQIYHFLYDLDNQKALVIDEFRGYRLYTGYNPVNGDVEFLKRDNEPGGRYNCLFETGQVLALSPDGSIRFKTTVNGNKTGYKAYLPMNAETDSLILYELNR
jgi:hypothetical protein